ncbi:hypothetical protein, partial [Pseudomonas gessardii]|uniref:hypothetical protein n=1 Tax=Pseudomonas gessardii TaxID=78544 RepID=UPI001CA4502E
LAGLLALASVLGVGEGHLLHRETRWVGSRYFAKSESLFQSFPFSFTFDINVLPCLQVEQFLSDMTLSGEIVLSLASYEGERKLTQF